MIRKEKNQRLLLSFSISKWIKDSAGMRKVWGRADLWLRCEKSIIFLLNCMRLFR